jgi:pimeloyl-ACP methyl ester carboxylesterase
MADDVAGLLRALGEAPAHLVGLSLGGCVAQALAVRHPEHVRSLVLVNTFTRLQPAGVRGLARLMGRLGLLAVAPMPAVAAHVAGGLFPKAEQRPLYDEAVVRLSRNARRPYIALVAAIGRFDLRREVGAVRCPTLILAGDRDTTVPRSAVLALHHAIPGSALRFIADSGHATPVDQPEAFNEAVLEFLSS